MTSPQRTYGLFANPGIPQDSLIVGWGYEWLFALSAVSGSWVLPLDVRRRAPSSGTPTSLAIRQLCAGPARLCTLR